MCWYWLELPCGIPYVIRGVLDAPAAGNALILEIVPRKRKDPRTVGESCASGLEYLAVRPGPIQTGHDTTVWIKWRYFPFSWVLI